MAGSVQRAKDEIIRGLDGLIEEIAEAVNDGSTTYRPDMDDDAVDMVADSRGEWVKLDDVLALIREMAR